MNMIEAIQELEKGKKIKNANWDEYEYVEKDGAFYHDERGTQYAFEIETNDDIYDDNWEVYKSEEEILNKKGKLYDIARYCNRTRCDKCVLYNEDACEGERETTRFCRLLLDEYFWADDWSDEEVDEMYKLIKEEI